MNQQRAPSQRRRRSKTPQAQSRECVLLLASSILAECASAYSCGSFCASAPCYGFSKDIGVVPVVVAELEFGDVQRQIFAADLVEGADDAALEDRPEAFNRVRVDRADDVLLGDVIDDLMGIFLFEMRIARCSSVASKLTLLDTISRTNVARLLSDTVQHARNNVALAADSADDGVLPVGCRRYRRFSCPSALFCSCRRSTFHQPRQCRQASAPVRSAPRECGGHVPSGFVASQSPCAPELAGANALSCWSASCA